MSLFEWPDRWKGYLLQSVCAFDEHEHQAATTNQQVQLERPVSGCSKAEEYSAIRMPTALFVGRGEGSSTNQTIKNVSIRVVDYVADSGVPPNPRRYGNLSREEGVPLSWERTSRMV